MTRFLAVLLSLGAVGAVQAQRASTTTMSCAQARDAVSRRGGVVLGTGGATYDRFVRDRSFCEITEVTIPAFVPARDDANCFVGYRCKEPGRGDRFDDGF